MKSNSLNSVFYSRNPANLKQNVSLVLDKNLVETVIIDYEFKKAIDYGILSQSLQSIQEFQYVKSLYLNLGNCALNTQKILLLMRGCSTFISKISQLYLLFENCNQIGLEGIEAICQILQDSNLNLEVLVISLRKCNIGVDAATILFKYIQNLKLRFISVNLDNNEIKYTAKFGNSLKQFLDNSNDIQAVEVCLSHNDIGSQGAKDISHAISNLKNAYVSYLNLFTRGNQLGDDSINYLSKNLAVLTQLKCISIGLDWNKITYKGAGALANAISQMVGLQSFSIDLDYNEIGAQGAQEISNCYQNAKDLQNLHINLAHNEIGDEGALLINLPQMKSIKNLSIELGWNKIGGEGLKAISNKIQNYKTLESLTVLLDNNNIASVGLQAISVCLLQLSNLQKLCLDLDDNGIPVDPVKALVTSLTGIPLQSLYVNLIKNEIDQNTIDSFSKLLLNNFPKIQSENFSLKSGQQKERSKITQSTGITGTIIRFCESSREKLQQNQTHLQIDYRDLLTQFQEEVQVDILQLLFNHNFNEIVNKQQYKVDEVIHENYSPQQQHEQSTSPQKAPIHEMIQKEAHSAHHSIKVSQKKEVIQVPPSDFKNLTRESFIEELLEQNNKLMQENKDLRNMIQNNQLDQNCKLLPFQDLICGNMIGSSQSGKLFHVTYNGQPLVMKVVILNVDQNNIDSKQLSLQFSTINDIIRAQHQYLLQNTGLSFGFKEDGQLKIYLLIDLMKYNLGTFVKEKGGNLHFDVFLNLMKKVLEVLVYFQKNNMVHGNLKPTNILLNDEYEPKISDYGIFKLIQFQKLSTESQVLNVLNPKYCGPDIFDGKESQYIDVWSFGCILFQVFSGESPWSGLNQYKQFNQMANKITILQHHKSLKDPIKLHPKIEEIIDKCTRYDNFMNAEQVMAIFPTSLTQAEKTVKFDPNEKTKTMKKK